MEGVVSPRSSKRLRPEPEGEAKPHAAQKFPGTTFTYGVGNADDAVVDAAKVGLRELCSTAGVDESHGVGHALKVLANLDAAVVAAPTPLPAPRMLAMRLAALLHDADDKKYFPETAATYANAARIAADSGAPAVVVAEAVKMIGWVSCSTNGNSSPVGTVAEPELLWPRWADRLEAVGEMGVARCFLYTLHSARPLSAATTPRPRTPEAALALATAERFERYQSSGGSSASMIDHYYDKLLSVARPPPEIVRNAFLEKAALKSAAPLLEVQYPRPRAVADVATVLGSGRSLLWPLVVRCDVSCQPSFFLFFSQDGDQKVTTSSGVYFSRLWEV